MTQSFQPSPELVAIGESLLLATAHEDYVRPIVERYEEKILEASQFRIDPHWIEHGVADQIILDRKKTMLLSSQDAKTFFAATFKARDEAGLKVSRPDNCPLLEAENLRIAAENILISEIGKLPGLEKLASGILTLDQRKRVIDLALRLLAPFMSNTEQILSRHGITKPQ
ncbi:hypothetical protein [Azonexus hydrophilus]|uniref:Uncharacterized protein n=1 Tax=Azonexus hydrophilus TaxID=418702 RepID=A0ABZ2XND3_9RHOO